MLVLRLPSARLWPAPPLPRRCGACGSGLALAAEGATGAALWKGTSASGICTGDGSSVSTVGSFPEPASPSDGTEVGVEDTRGVCAVEGEDEAPPQLEGGETPKPLALRAFSGGTPSCSSTEAAPPRPPEATRLKGHGAGDVWEEVRDVAREDVWDAVRDGSGDGWRDSAKACTPDSLVDRVHAEVPR